MYLLTMTMTAHPRYAHTHSYPTHTTPGCPHTLSILGVVNCKIWFAVSLCLAFAALSIHCALSI